MKRFKVNKRTAARNFNHETRRTKAVNVRSQVPRGGIRF